MGKFDGKVTFITGGGRGQGRAHATTFAQEGSDIAVLDICRNLAYPHYSLASQDDLNETVRQVKALGRKGLALVADVRNASEVEAAVKKTIETFGHIDILICNAGIAEMANSWDLTEEQWDAMIDINLKGYWMAAKYVVPYMIAQKKGGRIIMTSSTAGLKGLAGIAHYSASKFGVVGLAKSLALEVAQFNITVNTIHPTVVDTPMISGMAEVLGVTKEAFAQQVGVSNALPIAMVEAQDIANAASFLASEDARYLTGQELKVDAGYIIK